MDDGDLTIGATYEDFLTKEDLERSDGWIGTPKHYLRLVQAKLHDVGLD